MRQDVIIVGAPRSGTNMLRDVLTRMPGVATWPCDEINLVWRHGNRDHSSDELTPDLVTPSVRRYVTGQFDRIADKYDSQTVIEKTCATSLRLEFTREIFPDAKYIFITRDGVDCAASAIDRWNAPMDVRYTAAKSRYVPISDLPYYGWRFISNQVKRRRRSDGSIRHWWGPKPHDYKALLDSHALDEICMLQWQRCVDGARRGLSGLPDSQLFELSYETFVAEPAGHLTRLLDFLQVPHGGDLSASVAGVTAGSVGRGRKELGAEVTGRLETLAHPTLKDLGYVR